MSWGELGWGGVGENWGKGGIRMAHTNGRDLKLELNGLELNGFELNGLELTTSNNDIVGAMSHRLSTLATCVKSDWSIL